MFGQLLKLPYSKVCQIFLIFSPFSYQFVLDVCPIRPSLFCTMSVLWPQSSWRRAGSLMGDSGFVDGPAKTLYSDALQIVLDVDWSGRDFK